MQAFVTTFKRILLFSFLLFSSCAFAEPQVAELNTVKSCQHLQQLEGSSGFGKHPNWQIPAKHHALKQAEDIGATHIVWDKIRSLTGFNGTVIAEAYQCTNTQSASN